MKQVVAFCLGLLMCAVSNAQDVADWSEEIKYNKPTSTSSDTLGKEVLTEPFDGSIDVTMAPGVTRSFKDVQIGGAHPETRYFDEILEKPDFMEFKTDAVKKRIIPSPQITLVDFTLTADASAPEGQYTIRVKYNFHFGGPVLSDEILTVNLTIANVPKPVADFTGSPTSGPIFLNVRFTDRSSGLIERRSWDFGDGFTSTETNPSHLYTNVGTYTVKLTVDGPGGIDTKTRENYITATERPPVANFAATPTSGIKPLTVQFTNTSTGQFNSQSWDFGDGKTSTEPNPSHTYADAGTYTVALTVTGPGGSDTETKSSYISVREPPPVADFEGSPISGVKPLTVKFTDKTIGLVTAWSWTFGDGGTSTQQNPTHTYNNAGTFTVTLSVVGPGGTNTKTKSGYITVREPQPVADFTGSPTSGTKPLTVQFTDKSTGSITVRSWTFGDGGTSTATNPSHTYNDAGAYTVSLTVAGPGGSDTKTQENYITVNSRPVVANAIPDTTLRVGGGAFIRDLNTSPAVFTDPDGDALSYTASSSNPAAVGAIMSASILTVLPEAAGSATITITADDGKAGKASTVFDVQVLPVPPAAPELVSPSEGAANQSTTLTLNWNSATGAETYRLQVSISSAFTTTVFDDSTITSLSRQVGPLANNTTYYWRVKAKNAGGSSAWSGVWSFTTIVRLPNQVALLSPPEAAVISADSVRFVWRRSGPAASRYWFELATDSLLTNPAIDSTLGAADTTKTSRKLFNNQTYWWRVTARNVAGWGPFSAVRKFRIVITSVHTRDEVPSEFRLSQNYPNPFWGGATSRFAGNPSTTIEYALPQPSYVELKIYDVLGNEVRVLVNGKQPAGVHRVQFDSEDLPDGVYFYRLRAKERVEVRKMVILR